VKTAEGSLEQKSLQLTLERVDDDDETTSSGSAFQIFIASFYVFITCY